MTLDLDQWQSEVESAISGSVDDYKKQDGDRIAYIMFGGSLSQSRKLFEELSEEFRSLLFVEHMSQFNQSIAYLSEPKEVSNDLVETVVEYVLSDGYIKEVDGCDLVIRGVREDSWQVLESVGFGFRWKDDDSARISLEKVYDFVEGLKGFKSSLILDVDCPDCGESFVRINPREMEAKDLLKKYYWCAGCHRMRWISRQYGDVPDVLDSPESWVQHLQSELSREKPKEHTTLETPDEYEQGESSITRRRNDVNLSGIERVSEGEDVEVLNGSRISPYDLDSNSHRLVMFKDIGVSFHMIHYTRELESNLTQETLPEQESDYSLECMTCDKFTSIQVGGIIDVEKPEDHSNWNTWIPMCESCIHGWARKSIEELDSDSKAEYLTTLL